MATASTRSYPPEVQHDYENPQSAWQIQSQPTCVWGMRSQLLPPHFTQPQDAYETRLCLENDPGKLFRKILLSCSQGSRYQCQTPSECFEPTHGIVEPASGSWSLRSDWGQMFRDHREEWNVLPDVYNGGTIAPPMYTMPFVTDIGMNSSLSSTIEPHMVPTRSILTPCSDPRSGLELPYSQGNSYGSSNICGGFAVFGNVAGNLIINQYFGLVLPRHLDRSSLQPPETELTELDAIAQRGQNAEALWSLAQEAELVSNFTREELDICDIEFQQGQVEIKALGFETYYDEFEL